MEWVFLYNRDVREFLKKNCYYAWEFTSYVDNMFCVSWKIWIGSWKDLIRKVVKVKYFIYDVY